MIVFIHVRRWWPAILLLGLSSALLAQASQSAPAQSSSQPLPLKPDLPGMARNHRLILKDGSYQVVRQYQVVGDRVRYLSQERGEWEELPANLVDWDATRKWENEHNPTTTDQPSPAMKEAEEIDKEEADERNEQAARMPEVSPGLELPDEEGVFVLDTYQGTPELVELTPKNLNADAKARHGIGVLNPLAGEKADLELAGAHAKVHLHVNEPVLYVSLGVEAQKEPVLSHAFTVDTSTATGGGTGKHGAHSPQSGFAIVHVNERRAMRYVGAIHVSAGGTVTQDEDVIPADIEVLPGKHWMRLQVHEKLMIGGEYALVEILSPSDISEQVWDFRVDPTEGDNPGSLTPILKQTRAR